MTMNMIIFKKLDITPVAKDSVPVEPSKRGPPIIPTGPGQQVDYAGMSYAEKARLDDLIALTHYIIAQKLPEGSGSSICWLELVEEFKKVEFELQHDLMDLRIALAWLHTYGVVWLYDDRVERTV